MSISDKLFYKLRSILEGDLLGTKIVKLITPRLIYYGRPLDYYTHNNNCYVEIDGVHYDPECDLISHIHRVLVRLNPLVCDVEEFSDTDHKLLDSISQYSTCKESYDNSKKSYYFCKSRYEESRVLTPSELLLSDIKDNHTVDKR